jgi:hypothetical protein
MISGRHRYVIGIRCHTLDSHLTRVRHRYVRLQPRRIIGSKPSLLRQWYLFDYAPCLIVPLQDFLRTFKGVLCLDRHSRYHCHEHVLEMVFYWYTFVRICISSSSLCAPLGAIISSRDLQHGENAESSDPICRAKRHCGHHRADPASGYVLRTPE